MGISETKRTNRFFTLKSLNNIQPRPISWLTRVDISLWLAGKSVGAVLPCHTDEAWVSYSKRAHKRYFAKGAGVTIVHSSKKTKPENINLGVICISVLNWAVSFSRYKLCNPKQQGSALPINKDHSLYRAITQMHNEKCCICTCTHISMHAHVSVQI